MLAGKSRKESRERAESLLETVGLKERMHHRPNELSGGEQQRAAIARALINDPELLLADEPTGNLDTRTGEGILELFAQLRAERPDRSIVMITHNQEIAQLCDPVVQLKDGVFL
jgi:ABC-type lipoprotein export system ATPase subunit